MRTQAKWVSVAGVALLALCTACSSGAPTPVPAKPQVTGEVDHPSVLAGGTLRLLVDHDLTSWDPARDDSALARDVQRLYTRTLVTYAAAPGAAGLRLQPDLADSPPRISEGGKRYEFHLRKGLEFEDGEPITSRDVKYGVERAFGRSGVSEASAALASQLDPGRKYAGPAEDTTPGRLGLASVATPDDRTVVFRLSAPFADFPHLLATGAGAPVPAVKDAGAGYGRRPLSSGPYRFAAYEPGRRLTLVRNPHWSRDTDPVRRALPDRVELTVTSDPESIGNIIGSGAADVVRLSADTPLKADVLKDGRAAGSIRDTPSGLVRQVSMQGSVAPLDNIHCRRAVLYAADPSALRAAGGGSAFADIATNLLPPDVLGAEPAWDPYRLAAGKQQEGLARNELKQCGRPHGFGTGLAVQGGGRAAAASATALRKALDKVGIRLVVDTYEGKNSPSAASSPVRVRAKGYGLVMADWEGAWPTGIGYLKPLVDARTIPAAGDRENRPQADQKTVDRLLDRAATQSNQAIAADTAKQINQQLMIQAWYLPVSFGRIPTYRNPRLTNVYDHPAFGMPDLQALGTVGLKG